MITAPRTFEVTLPQTDAAFLKKQAKCMGWKIISILPNRKSGNSEAKRRTLKAISDVRQGKDVTHCASFEEYLRNVAQ